MLKFPDSHDPIGIALAAHHTDVSASKIDELTLARNYASKYSHQYILGRVDLRDPVTDALEAPVKGVATMTISHLTGTAIDGAPPTDSAGIAAQQQPVHARSVRTPCPAPRDGLAGTHDLRP
jgi:hypothetical protein